MKSINLKRLILPNLPYLLFVFLFDKVGQAARLAPGADLSGKLLSIGDGFAAAFSSFAPSLHPADLLVGVLGAALIRLVVYVKGKNAKKYRRGVEYGSARWGSADDIRPYIDPVFENNVLLTQTERLMMNSRPKQPKYARNKNVLVVGGSGSGKTRFFVKPNLMQMHSSYLVSDPKGTLLLECGKLLERGSPKLGEDGKPVRKNGKLVYEPYRIKVLNTINFKKSMKYNPFAYLRDEKDILKLVNTLIANTKGSGEKSGEDFWVKAERLLYCVEKKGIISDRCELNRQIKADNALLRELKAAVKKLAQEVLHSLPELAKSMEFLRQKLLIFCYQLNHIRTGKSVIGKSVDAWNINLNRYSEVVDQIKETKRERTDLLAEKKELPFWNIPRKNELTARIAELTELLEELQSEKAILLDNMDCTDGKDVSKVRKKVALMEANLKELDEQEQKYSAELETALAEYAELKTQGEQFDPVELHDTRQELRPEMEQTAVQRVKEKYGDKYSHRTMDDSKRDVSRHLDEYAESQEIRQIQREREYQQRRQNKAKQERKKQDDWER